MVTDLKQLGQVAIVFMVLVMLAGCGIKPENLSAPSGGHTEFPATYPR
jgi:uncharacterized protein YceK